jgi:hypothetical protein
MMFLKFDNKVLTLKYFSMNSKSLFVTLLCVFLIFFSCQEDPEPTDPTNPPVQTGDFEVKDLQVVLPQGSSFDLVGSEVFSYGESFPVSSDGKSKTVSTPGFPYIAFLFDKNENPILAGYITDRTSDISPQSTAIVLLSYAVGLNLRAEGFTELFLDQINELPEAQAWQEEFAQMWKNDPLVLEKGTYTAKLREVMEKLVPEPEVIDIRANTKVSQIALDEGDIKSGLNLFEDGLGQFSVNNQYRRRAHAFLYKISYKDMQDKSHVVLSAINSGTVADQNFAISPTAGATSFNGVLGNEIEGKSGEVGIMKSGPIKLDLLEIESEATYKLHVVGPGISHPQPVTTAEFAKLTRLEIETFAIDFMFPLIMETLGNKDVLKKKGINIGEGPVERFIESTESFLKLAPDVYELVKNGDYMGAARKSLELLYADAFDGAFETLSLIAYDIILDGATVSGFKVPKLAESNAEKVVGKTSKWLKIINTAMLGGDFIRIGMGILDSRQFEEWTIKARSAKVSLTPKESTVRSRGSKAIEAKIINLEEGDTHPFFVWKSSGKFGYIQDTKGNKGESFESSDFKITYYSNTSASELPEENNWEYVYVEAFLGSQSIGKDTVKLNLRKSVYELKPDGITLTGKKGGINNANSVGLYIERTDGSAPDFSDKKVVWTTTGAHGRLNGRGGTSTTITTYGTNSINYKCTDEDTKKATEKVYAKIYAESSDGSDYFLYEELEATININNDDKTIIKHYALESRSSQGQGVSNCMQNDIWGTIVEIEPNAVSYTWRLIDVERNIIGASKSYSWKEGEGQTTHPFFPGILIFGVNNLGGSYWVGYAGRSYDCRNNSLPEFPENKGTAEVIITLK